MPHPASAFSRHREPPANLPSLSGGGRRPVYAGGGRANGPRLLVGVAIRLLLSSSWYVFHTHERHIGAWLPVVTESVVGVLSSVRVGVPSFSDLAVLAYACVLPLQREKGRWREREREREREKRFEFKHRRFHKGEKRRRLVDVGTKTNETAKKTPRGGSDGGGACSFVWPRS